MIFWEVSGGDEEIFSSEVKLQESIDSWFWSKIKDEERERKKKKPFSGFALVLPLSPSYFRFLLGSWIVIVAEFRFSFF